MLRCCERNTYLQQSFDFLSGAVMLVCKSPDTKEGKTCLQNVYTVCTVETDRTTRTHQELTQGTPFG